MYRRNKQSWLKHLDFILLDIIALELGFILAYGIRFGFNLIYQIDKYRNLGLALAAVDFLVSVLFNTMHNVLRRGPYVEFVQSLKQAALILAVMSLYMFSPPIGRRLQPYNHLSYRCLPVGSRLHFSHGLETDNQKTSPLFHGFSGR